MKHPTSDAMELFLSKHPGFHKSILGRARSATDGPWARDIVYEACREWDRAVVYNTYFDNKEFQQTYAKLVLGRDDEDEATVAERARKGEQHRHGYTDGFDDLYSTLTAGQPYQSGSQANASAIRDIPASGPFSGGAAGGGGGGNDYYNNVGANLTAKQDVAANNYDHKTGEVEAIAGGTTYQAGREGDHNRAQPKPATRPGRGEAIDPAAGRGGP